MIATRKVNKNVVAVLSFGVYPASISLRNSGREYYGTEKDVVHFEEDKLVIDKKVLNHYGLSLEIKN